MQSRLLGRVMLKQKRFHRRAMSTIVHTVNFFIVYNKHVFDHCNTLAHVSEQNFVRFRIVLVLLPSLRLHGIKQVYFKVANLYCSQVSICIEQNIPS